MLITVTKRIQVGDKVLDYSASADVAETGQPWAVANRDVWLQRDLELIQETALALFKVLPMQEEELPRLMTPNTPS